MYHWVLGILIPLKLLNASLYLRFIQGKVLASQVMDYIYEQLDFEAPSQEVVSRLHLIEGYLYLDNRQGQREITLQQLQNISDGQPVTNPEYISRRVQNADQNTIRGVLRPATSSSQSSQE